MDDTQLIKLKKKLKVLKKYKGQGTQLISLYLPPDADRSSVTKQLTDEISQSSNIKSSQTRKNVQAALRRITNYLKQIDFQLPKNGLVLFSGDISTNPSKSDVTLIDIVPPKKLTSKLYWCDSTFHLTALEDMAETDDAYGIIAVDKREATIALIKGKSQEIVGHETSNVPGKTRAGGQCIKNAFIQLNDGNLIDISNLENKTKIISVDFKKYKLTNTLITNKWNVNKSKTYIIKTKNPSFEIETSEDHTFFINTNIGVKNQVAKKLVVGDYLLIPEKININIKKLFKLSSKIYYNSFKIIKKGQVFLLNKRLEKGFSQKDLAKKIKLTQAAISKIELGKRNVSTEVIKKICDVLNINYFNFIDTFTKISIINNTIKLPTNLDKKFAKFLGYIIGDGSIERDRVTVFEENKQVAYDYKKEYDSYFKLNSSLKLRISKNYYQIRFTSRPLVRLIISEFPEIKKARNSTIPSKILKSPNFVVASFIKGLFDAEGYASVNKKVVAFSVNNKALAQQLQLLLLRFSILSSIIEYDNRANKYTNNHRFTIQISERKSIILFKKYIGFTSKIKQSKLQKIILLKSDISYSRQILISGKKIKQIIEKYNYNLESFPKVSNFFNNTRMISKQTFEKSILINIKNKKLYSELKNIMDYALIPVKINKINIISEKSKMVDISVINKNFIANGLVVHNSAHRFERLREKAAQDFLKRVCEKVNSAYLGVDRLKGIVVGGPGHTKKLFLEVDRLDYRLKEKVLGTVDTSYTDESGIKEILDKSGDILSEVGLIQERNLVNKFVGEVAKNNLATYGFKYVENALYLGQADTILVSSAIEWSVLKLKCNDTKEIFYKVIKDKLSIDSEVTKYEAGSKECGGKPAELIEELDVFDYFVDVGEKTDTKVKLVSVETQEGKQFFDTFGGIGAILRYK